ncbi:MAG: GxxExxY protein [Trichlorobacter sp.]|uniref:GxxExxY protein n=1 Tax=Trichlorobacter sp. TaxID=2911007 RepID=UPI00256E64B3|nr:GxxExxY protein [Trichlorobacter sp.]
METQSNGATEKSCRDADLTNSIIGCAIEVHKTLGPGLLESVYESCLMHELVRAGCLVERQKKLLVNYKGLEFEEGFRIDLLVNDTVIVELKCVERLLPIHEAQLYTYLKLSGKRTGLLINFLSKLLKDGIQRIAC